MPERYRYLRRELPLQGIGVAGKIDKVRAYTAQKSRADGEKSREAFDPARHVRLVHMTCRIGTESNWMIIYPG